MNDPFAYLEEFPKQEKFGKKNDKVLRSMIEKENTN